MCVRVCVVSNLCACCVCAKIIVGDTFILYLGVNKPLLDMFLYKSSLTCKAMAGFCGWNKK